MLDFLKIKVIGKKKGTTYVTPTFLVTRSKDLMTRGKSFYAIWDEETGLWSKDEYRAISLIDEEIKKKAEEVRASVSDEVEVVPLLINDYGSRKMTEWQSYVKALPDNFHDLDKKVMFANSEIKKKDYVSKRLGYPLKEGTIAAYHELVSTLYDPDELMKLEWAVGAIISGDAKSIQKFIVLYGDSGAGKSTFLNIIEKLFQGYYTYFEAKTLASNNDMFALEDFKDDPLVAIQHDGDLSRIEDNTKLNSIVSHEKMVVNEKFKSKYTAKFDSFLFMGTNKPVKITDAKSGIIRRLIDVHPSGRLVPYDRYMALIQQIDFELGAIAEHCLKLYSSLGANYYDKYKANTMIGATNEFYNFMSDNYDMMCEENGVTLGAIWAEYQKYCADTKTPYPYPRMKVKEELKNYFDKYVERDGGRYKVYKGFRKEKFDYVALGDKEKEEGANGGLYSLVLDKDESIFDAIYADCPAQLASDDETPSIKWSNVKTKLKDIDTHKIHYVLVPENLVVIDFDFKDKDGKKDMTRNLMEASKWPATYAEFSKGGGVHLHYIYDGDVLNLSKIYEENIEVKVFKKADGTRGFSSLRRKLTKCNGKDIVTINSGLPLKKGAKDVVNEEVVLNEKALRTLIFRAVNKEYHGYTAPNIDLINKALDNAYKSGKSYDVSDLRPLLISFAGKSSNQASRCLSVVANMKFMSDDMKHADEESEVVSGLVRDRDEMDKMVEAATNVAPIIFFDVEVFPNLLVICWKFDGTPRDATVKMINPTPEDVQKLFKYRLVGFNNRRYDNHIVYAASIGYSNKKIFEISQGIISSSKKDSRRFMFGAAYNLSYTDIYDFCFEKKSLKKWEIEMGVHHQELGLPWDLPVDESLWEKVADYCVNDVMATEALFHYQKDDWVARQILADVADGTVNDTTNALTTKLIFGNVREPMLVYTDFKTGKQMLGRKTDVEDVTNPDVINVFPGYDFVMGDDGKMHNMYRGTDVGRGGYVLGKPGMYINVALLDISSMHPTSAILLNKFGEYTPRYAALKQARVYIKHEEYDEAGKLFDGKLKKYLTDKESAEALAKALKYPINAEYGQSSATYENPSRDPRDVNNIIALRGALFMRTLQDEVEARGFDVIHIKTDSIKIPDATQSIIDFVMEFGRKYGYEFEHECTYEKMCLVNDAVYIAKYDEKGVRNKHGKHAGEWTATGAQFAQPYVFKTLFSKEPIENKDVCETKETSKGLGLYLDMNEGYPSDALYQKELDKLTKKKEPTEADLNRIEELKVLIAPSHNYQFIGKVGQFCPVISGAGGGILVRENNGKFDAVTGTKKESYDKEAGEEPVYRWLESEVVANTNKWKDVDHSYYRHLVDEAVKDISKYGDFEWFTSDDPVPKPIDMSFMNIPEDAEGDTIPFDTK